MTKEYLDLKFDFMFKQLFGQSSRMHVTLAFINDLLGREGDDRIKDIIFANTEIIKDHPNGKTNRLDLKVVTEIGEHINIEVQIENQYDIPERIHYYWAKIYSSLIRSGEPYSLLTPTIFITILNYPFYSLPSQMNFTPSFILRKTKKTSYGATICSFTCLI